MLSRRSSKLICVCFSRFKKSRFADRCLKKAAKKASKGKKKSGGKKRKSMKKKK